MYRFYAATNDMQVLDYLRDDAFRVNVDAIEALCEATPRPRILFLASPNNPDGGVLSDEELERLLRLPLMVVLDEAYVEFSGRSRVGWVAERENLIVLRTFSKWAGLAGLRVGYGVFPQVLAGALYRLKSPYNVSGIAQAGALATLEDLDKARANIERIVAERGRLMEKLREFPFLRVYDTQANYVLCRVNGISMDTIRQAMERRGVILRYYDSIGLADCFRISVGTPMQDESALIVLRALEQAGG
jgi:histidinol-phosphate aminotransferase